jgi:hypothetical protein
MLPLSHHAYARISNFEYFEGDILCALIDLWTTKISGCCKENIHKLESTKEKHKHGKVKNI